MGKISKFFKGLFKKLYRAVYNLFHNPVDTLGLYEDDLICVCLECGEEVIDMWVGDEGWTVCTGCNSIEGETKYISVKDYDLKYYN